MDAMDSNVIEDDRPAIALGAGAFERPLGQTLSLAQLGNGVSVNVRQVPANGLVMITMRIGAGLLGCDPARLSPRWAVDAGGFLLGGTRDLPYPEIILLLESAGFIMFSNLGDDCLAISMIGKASELATALGILASYAERPAFRQELVSEVKIGYERQVFAKFNNTAEAAAARYLQEVVHGGDFRWRTPDLEDIRWTTEGDILSGLARLAVTDYIDVTIAGDIPPAEGIEAVRRQFSQVQLPFGDPASIEISPASFPTMGRSTVVQVRDPGEEAAFAAWPVADYYANPRQARVREMLHGVLQRRLAASLGRPVLGRFEASQGAPGFGFLLVGAGMPASGAQGFWNLVEDSCRAISSGNFTDDEVASVRDPLLLRERQSEISFAHAAAKIMGWSRRPERVEAASAIEACLSGIERDDLVEAAEATLHRDLQYAIQFRASSTLQ